MVPPRSPPVPSSPFGSMVPPRVKRMKSTSQKPSKMRRIADLLREELPAPAPSRDRGSASLSSTVPPVLLFRRFPYFREENLMQQRKQPETLRLRSLVPSLTVNDLQASIAWYRDILGFIVAEEYKQDDQVMGVRLQAGTVNFLLTQDDFAKGRDRQKGVGLRFFCMTAQDIDQLAATVRER